MSKTANTMATERYDEICDVIEAVLAELGDNCGVDAVLAALPPVMHAEVLAVLGMA